MALNTLRTGLQTACLGFVVTWFAAACGADDSGGLPAGQQTGGANSAGGKAAGGAGVATGGMAATGNGGTSTGGSGQAAGGVSTASGGSGPSGGTQGTPAGGSLNDGGKAAGGTIGTGGSNAGGTRSGGSSGSGTNSGGTAAGGTSTGGSGVAKGGSLSGGTSSGGQPSGGTSSGGASSGGKASGGSGTGGASGGSSGGSSGGTGSGTLRIMAIGDSITRATCWRAKLWQTLTTNHSGRFDMVGTLTSDNGCSPTNYDKANQGYGSALVTEIVAGITNERTCDPSCPTLNDLATAFNSQQPDVALVHFGTNDVWNGKAAADIVAAYGQVVDKLRAANPNVKVLIAQIIPMNVTSATCSGCSCSGCATAVPALNSQIASWAPTKSSTQSPITVVDQYTGFDVNADTRDGVHPNDSGSTKMASKWAAALEALF